MRIEPFQRGEMDALGEAVDLSIEPVWRLLRRGFLTEVDGVRCFVQGVDGFDDAETLVEHAVAACLDPERRQKIDGRSPFDRSLLLEVRTRATDHAIRHGLVVDVANPEALAEVPDGVEDLDRLIAEGMWSGQATVPPDAGAAEEAAALKTIRDEYVSQLDERSRELVGRRFEQSESRETIAAAWTCGKAAVVERENRLRRKLRHRIRRVFPGRTLGPATTDALLANGLLADLPPRVTIERLRSNILKRIHIEAPQSFGVRTAWALGAAAVAFGLWLMMFLGLLPYYDDDTYPAPEVRVVCEGACQPGAAAKVHVTAPQDATNVAILTMNMAGEPTPWLVSPTKTSLRLPFGARSASTPIPYAVTLPTSATSVMAVFAGERLASEQITVAARTGELDRGHVVTARIEFRLPR